MIIHDSIELLKAVQENNKLNIQLFYGKLKTVSRQKAFVQLNTDQKKIIFWSNIYNALFQVGAMENRKQLSKDWSGFFKLKQISLFGETFSLDFVEHHLLRRSKWKYGLGYLNKLFVSKFEKDFRVDKVDYRIHFILNCGAKSCPIIRFLDQNNFEEQLSNATIDYLENEIIVDEKSKQIELNQLFLFYKGDFGGFKGLKKVLLKHNFIGYKHLNYSFKFTTFNKELKLANFKA